MRYQEAISDAIRVANVTKIPRTVCRRSTDGQWHVLSAARRLPISGFAAATCEKPLTILPRDYFTS